MLYLLLSIFSSVLLFVVFRQMGNPKVNNFQAVVINYWVAGAIGIAIFHGEAAQFVSDPGRLGIAALLGCLFIGIFYLMVKTTQEYSISVGSVANKMSVVIPACAALIIYSEPLTWNKLTGIIIAPIALYLTNKKPGVNSKKLVGILPLAVFLGSGLIDTLLNFAAYRLVEKFEGSFTTFIFLCAGVVGTVFALIKSKKINRATLIGGLILGTVNFCTIYFVLKALNSRILDAGAFFPVNNISIVLGSVLVSVLFFNEKLTTLNKIGIACAAVSILVLSL